MDIEKFLSVKFKDEEDICGALLRERDGVRRCFVGVDERSFFYIMHAANAVKHPEQPRILHGFVLALMESVGMKVEQILIVPRQTEYGVAITVSQSDGRIKRLPCPIVDAVAFAIFSECPIMISDRILDIAEKAFAAIEHSASISNSQEESERSAAEDIARADFDGKLPKN